MDSVITTELCNTLLYDIYIIMLIKRMCSTGATKKRTPSARFVSRLDYEGIHVVIGSSLFWWDCAGTYTWSKPVMKGTHPSPRDSHSSTAVKSKLYVFGGTDGTSPLNDLFVLDTATNTWGKPDVFGDVPAPREGHSASLIGDNLFVFGGYTFVWKKISTTGVSPIPQDSHTCSFYKNCFVVMGGEDAGNAYLNDVYILDTAMLFVVPAEVLEGQVNLLRVELGEVQLAKLLAGKRWIRRHGIPSLVAKPLGCRKLKCLISPIPKFIQKSGPHKVLVKVILFSDTGEHALPFVREAAKKYSELTSFGCVLWRQEGGSIWKSRLGLELAPAVVFIKDPGVQPIIVYGKLTRDSFMETVEEYMHHGSKLGCDPADFSAAGKDVETWYCNVVAGRPGFQLDQLRSTMRIVQDELVSEDIDSHNFAAATAYKDKRLSLSWLDNKMQKKFCYYCLGSEPVHETCGWRQYQEQDVARILMIHFRRDPNCQKPVVKRINTWWHLDDEEQDLALMLIAPYSGANEISEVLSWISNSVHTNEIPFFVSVVVFRKFGELLTVGFC
ncbi:hypothetical protein SELMODRAFT_432129 [Selaginella moellendorffii]|uniref:Uncharacterized protein n=1 Tax=Selaginella moellendorffii TaxID=88036 RepID=D8TF25_SELML|nr:hypothetical protein SELMODRAFT_432129 [Selaginella moellendorffii]